MIGRRRPSARRTAAATVTGAAMVASLAVMPPAQAESGETALVSKTAAGEPGSSGSWFSDISDDGMRVVFATTAPNLAAGASPTRSQIVMADVATGELRNVSLSPTGEPANGGAGDLPTRISGDGATVVFRTSATNLVAGAPPGGVYAVDDGGSPEVVSLTSGGAPAAGVEPSVSDDGSVVAFESSAALVPEDTNGLRDIYAHDRTTGQTSLASVASDGTPANSWSLRGEVSGNGRYVFFDSLASNLGAGDTEGSYDVFRHDLVTGRTVLASPSAGGGFSGIPGYHGSPSADGRYVAYVSAAPDKVSGDTNGVADVFVHDLQSGTTVRASVGRHGAQADGGSSAPSLSSDGRSVTFRSLATNLAGVQPGTTDPSRAPFYSRDLVRDWTTWLELDASRDQPVDWARASGDGRSLTYTHTDGTNYQVWRFQRGPQDTSAPGVQLTLTPPAVTSDDTPTFEFTSDDPRAVFDCSLTPTASSWTACEPPYTTGPLPHGDYTFSVRAIDPAGNRSEVATYAFTVGDPGVEVPAPSTPDLTAASDTGLSATDNVTADTTPTLTGSSAPGTSVQVLVDGVERGAAATTDGGYAVTTTELPIGTHSVTAVAVDGAGNTSPASDPLTVQVVAATACHTASNRIAGNVGNNRLTGTSLADLMFGYEGNDMLDGRAHGDCLVGGTGTDKLSGGTGDDEVLGDDGDDRIALDGGSDSAAGGAGNDRVYARDDTRDVVDCGAGTADRAWADPIDEVVNCETVRVG